MNVSPGTRITGHARAAGRAAGTGARRGLVWICLGLTLLLGCREDRRTRPLPGGTVRAGAQASPRGGPVLLLTHPTVKVMRDFVFLVENKILEVPGLRLVGLYHEEALDHWRSAARFARRAAPAWVSLRKVRCKLREADVFRPNACTDAFRELVSTARGIVFTGGPDLPPSLYGGPAQLISRVGRPARHWFEASFLYHLVGRVSGAPAPDRSATAASPRAEPLEPLVGRFPRFQLLAICLGMETLNVAAGGTLVQDVPSELYGATTAEQVLALPRDHQHACYDHLARSSIPRQLWTSHPIQLTRGWPFANGQNTPGPIVEVITAHHQAVGALAAGLEVWARSTDGKVIEALGHTRFPNVFGVQFHPEYSKAFTAQRQCASAAGLDAKPRYRLSRGMIAFYRQFWRAFSERLARSY